jgi:site-specific recombinase XerD
VSGDQPADVRNRAVILLLATYGFRIGEVSGLTLDDVNWQTERIYLRRPKQRKIQEYPLTTQVGAAILQYLKEVRPRSAFREAFLTLSTPYRPIPARSLGSTIGGLVRALGLHLPHYGPHVLRHACATHLLSKGFSLKEIGDHLGHRSAQATRIYAKVDLPSLRQVARQDLSDLIEHTKTRQQETKLTLSEERLAALREVARLSLGGVQ